MSGNANKNWPSNAMSESRPSASPSDPGRPGSRGRSHSQASNPSRRQQLRQSFQAPIYPAPHSNAPPESTPTASPSFQSIAASYPSTPLAAYGPRGPFVGQYTMSPPPPAGMPQYAYAPHHPGLHAPDTNMHTPQNPLLGYNPNTLVPMMQSPHTPVFQGYGQSPEGSSTSSHSHSFPGSPGSSALYSRSPGHASPPSPLNPQGSGPHPQTIHPPHSAPYAAQSPYAPLRYSTPPFPYPPHSYAPSSPLYAAHSYAPSHYPPHSYAHSPEAGQEGQGTWWYLPPARPGPASGQYESFQNAYSLPFGGAPQRDVDAYSQTPGLSPLPSPHYPISPGQAPASVPYSPAQALPPPMVPDVQQPARLQSDAGPSSQRPRPSDPGPSAPSSARSGTAQARRGQQRQHPPTQRSEWVMWVGNVPSDTTHDELWRFLNHTPTPPAAVASATSSASSAGASGDTWGGVISIFLISRSNCAFVNFTSEAHLLAAIRHFNGQQLRPGDPRCPRLVCRVRGRDDDLKAGVGGQRGMGLHVRWIRDQKEKAVGRASGEEVRSPTTSEPLTTPSSSPSDPAPLLAHLNLSSDEEGGRGHRYRPHPHSSSSGSYASTNSSILMQHFPKRYFILKSLTQKDLDISVTEGLWATQKHNELTLDQAFRTSKEVYLIFGVNKSGEFYGYARMVGPIQRGEHRVSWSSRADSPTHRRASRSSVQSTAGPQQSTFFSPAENRYEESPLPVSPDPPSQSQSRAPPPPSSGHRHTLQGETPGLPRHSAPPELHHAHRQLSRPTDSLQPQTADERNPPRAHARQYDRARSLEMQAQVNETIARASDSLPEEFHLDPQEPLRHIREQSAPPQSAPEEARRWESAPEHTLDVVSEEESKSAQGDAAQADRDGPSWGEPFKIQWIRTDRLPFYRTRHLRNPWNHDREVKVSRDGTELEPTVGQALLDEWERPAPPPPVGTPAGDRRQRALATEEAPPASPSMHAPSAGEGG
ncbi:hypothetical protein DAEQUDRAFT_362059 [Daedalea quercina L-15889]|uniref:YTH domain-containing protein n=1 Tax=Daedalea quercina L-15889 TaxID=1314783 RepID=A0A165TTT1_9APHY|nr:hypothetical protein DAEQUDRAFT_362059 [Daedalea quercina L-15889]